MLGRIEPATIFAPATAGGRAGVAVVRVSGPAARRAHATLTAAALPEPRRATRCRLTDPATGEALDDGLALWFPAPASYTGEDVLELQVHGGRAVLAGLMTALGALPGFRPAEPGEFTRRAFHNGKLDLTEVEGLADLIDAETAAQRRQALAQLGGTLGRLYEGWRAELLRLLAHVEADIDFPDEALPDGLGDAARGRLAPLIAAMRLHLDDAGAGERLRDGFSVAIVGPPNAGKSSLLNALAGREAAIVSERAGTTRDVIEVHLDIGGYPVVLADTAGIQETDDPVEREGIRRALARAARSDLTLVVTDNGIEPVLPEGVAVLRVAAKADLGGAAGPDAIPVSARTGAGLETLIAALGARAAARLPVGSDPVLTRARHRAAVAETVEALARAGEAPLPELAAEDIRLAVRALGRITGRVDIEDILDVVFSEFCIGK